MSIEHGELKTDGKIMKLNVYDFFTTLIIIISIIIYVTNFIQMLIAILNEQWSLAVVKAVGVFTLLGSIITVWF